MRLERMDKEAAEAEAQRTFEERQRQHAQAAEERTAKNRLKRAKKKVRHRSLRRAGAPRAPAACPHFRVLGPIGADGVMLAS